MIWKFSLLVFMLSFNYSKVYSQPVHYFKDGARWVYSTTESYEPGQIFKYSNLEENVINGDTVIGNIKYSKLYKRFVHTTYAFPPNQPPVQISLSYEDIGPVFIRIDENENRVYFLGDENDNESLIYDFNSLAGDTLHTGCTEKWNTIKTVDTVYFSGNNLKLFNTDTGVFPVANGVVEGIGGLNGLTECLPFFPAISGGLLMKKLICFSYEGRYYFPDESTLECPPDSVFTTAVDGGYNDNFKPLAIPNPNFGDFEIKVPDYLTKSDIEIYNLQGKREISLQFETNFVHVHLPHSGVYHYRIIKNGKYIFSGRIAVLK